MLTLLAIAGCGGSDSSPTPAVAPPPTPPTNASVDLLSLDGVEGFARVFGADSTGRFGVPVAAGFDCDGDGFLDYAVANMQAAPFGRSGAGQALLIFGNGQISGNLDTATFNGNVLRVAGSAPNEAAAGEIWLDDVTGDGLGDLIVGRFNYREPNGDRLGAGALSVVVGGPALRDLAASNTILDLAAPPAGINVLTLVGANALDRLGFWMRTGDATGDGLADILVGADQEDSAAENNRGAAYLLRGGAHLNTTAKVDLADFGATQLAGQIAKISPPAGSDDYHFGATVALADLDANGVAEALLAASLSRVGGLLVADGAPVESAVRNGGNLGGSLFIVWYAMFSGAATWPAGFTLIADAAPGVVSRIDGGSVAGQFTNERFGEELLGGLDYDGDGTIDLFVGDITGESAGRNRAGVGHVFFDAVRLKTESFSMSQIPPGLRVTTILGPAAGVISSDTALHGDIDGDGLADLVVASPLASPFGRTQAGTLHVLWGQSGPWPAVIDLATGARPAANEFLLTDVHGARGERSANDTGDTLMYSAVGADLNADGQLDLVINEMRGNGVATTALDVGNLLIISGALLPKQP